MTDSEAIFQENGDGGEPSAASPDRAAQPIDAEQPPRLPFPVVGIGASAGGLEAVSEFLAAMPPDAGMAFVLVQHLPPDRDSMMVEILAKRTAMPVRQVEDGMPVQVNHVYVIRPGHVLTIRDGVLRLGAQLDGPRSANRPIDDFFKSLAEEQRERAIAIIMSGMGSNGAAGAQSLKSVGGLCVAQEPDSAQFPSMPRHLIDAGNADYILRPREMPDVLMAYAGHPYARGAREADAATTLQRNEGHLRDILTILRNRTRTNFAGYKKPTLLRRVQRRMGLARLTEMNEYVRLLRQSPGEVAALADDLLIHVTGFFRNADAWDVLRARVIVPLIASREGQDHVRCWVTACSTGDEAYTLAMLLIEEAERAGKPLDIKVFATDMADRTLSQARAGVYPGGIEAEISPERLARFFHKEDAVYRIKPEVRERVVFAPQNVLQDPPFSRLDIVTCRNLLIYLEPDVQRRVLELLHFGLRDGGALFLGTSETISGDSGMFEPVDKKARIFRRVGPTRHGAVEFPLIQGLRDLRHGAGAAQGRASAEKRAPARATWAQLTQRTLLEHFVPPAVLVDREHRILFFQGETRPFLGQPTGEPSHDLMAMATDGVRAAARVALRRAAAENQAVTVLDGWIENDQGVRVRVAITASPASGATDHFVVAFDLRNESVPSSATDAVAPGGSGQDVADELRRVRDELQSTNEELQTTNEEMRAAAEEASSVNEELQSTNEELETSKEEMQSLNEELNTVNSQLQAKMEEHQATSNDLSSLLASTDIAVLFLDPRLRIRRFTPAVRELMELLASDVGRPLSDFAPKFTDPHLTEDARAVLEKLVPIEREVAAATGRWYIRRITPYRTADDRIDGVVVAFVDVTARVQTAARLAETARLLDLSNDAIIVRNAAHRITYWNHGAAELFGYSTAEAIGQELQQLLRTEFEPPREQLVSELRNQEHLVGEVVQFARDGRRLTLLCRWAMDRNVDDAAGSILTTMTDISDRKRAEEAVSQARAEAEAANGVKDEFLATLSHELRTPLSAILLWADNLLHLKSDQKQLAQGLTAIRTSAHAQKGLIDDLLDTARITSRKVRLQPRNLDLRQLVREGIDTVLPAAEAKGVTVAADLDLETGTVFADPERLRQVVWNLMSNAVKFTSTGGRVDVRLSKRGRSVQISVSDTGQGIAPDFLPHVFTPFRQADGSSTRRHGGLGLGLAICKELVELHGGTIRAESGGLGQGATFVVSLPLPSEQSVSGSTNAMPEDSQMARQADSPEQIDSQRRLHAARVLLVEDDLDTRQGLAVMLRGAGATVIAVDSAAAALAAMEADRPDVLLCDIGLPEMDGLALIRLLRARERSANAAILPAVALSAFAREQDVQAAIDAGFQHYLKKPVDPHELLLTLERIIAIGEE